MATPTPIRKLTLALRLLVAMQHPQLSGALGAVGLDEEELEEGWRLFLVAARAKPTANPSRPDRTHDQRLLAFHERWFPLTRLALRAHLGPAGVEELFPSPPVRRRAAPALQVTYFIARIRDLGRDGRRSHWEARELLRQHGLSDALLDEGERLIEESTAVLAPPVDCSGPVDSPELDALWRWYCWWQDQVRRLMPSCRKSTRARSAMARGNEAPDFERDA